MATISSNGAKGHHKFTLNVTENSTSIIDNTSTISFTFKISPVANGWDWAEWGSNISYVVNINGTKYKGTIPAYDGYATVTLKSGSLTIPHNSDGTKSISISFSVDDNANQYYTSGDASASGTMILSTIPRASSINGGSGNIGESTKITITRANEDFTHTLKYEFGGLTGTIAEDIETSYTWEIPESFYGEIKNSNTGTGKIVCETYNGDTLIGTSEVEFTANVVNSNPVINAFTYEDSNDFTFAITEDRQRIIRDNSNLLFTIGSASPQNSATITKYEITFNDRTLERTSAGTLDFGRINLSSNSKAVLKVTDSRGNTSTKEIEVIIDDWKLPTGLITCNRRNNFYSETLLKVDSTHSSLNGKNSVSIQYQYRKTTDKNFSELFDLEDNVQASVELDNNYQWHIIVIVGDRIGETKYNLYIDRGIPLAFFDKLRSSMGINCFPQNDGSFEIDGNIYSDNMFLNGENLSQRIKGYGEVAKQVFGDYNTMCGNVTGFYRSTTTQNAPYKQSSADDSSNWFFIIHIAHSESYQMQIASPYFKEGLYYRNMINGTWGKWSEIMNQPETGSDDNSSWVKYPDGRMEIYQHYETTVAKADWGAWGSGYGVALDLPPNFPIPFVGKDPIVTQTLETSNGNGLLVTRTEGTSYSSLTRAGACQVFRPTTGINATYRVSVHAVGRWK